MISRRSFVKGAAGLLLAETAIEPVRRFWPGWDGVPAGWPQDVPLSPWLRQPLEWTAGFGPSAVPSWREVERERRRLALLYERAVVSGEPWRIGRGLWPSGLDKEAGDAPV